MWRFVAFLAVALILTPQAATPQEKTDEQEIGEAVSPLPENLRDGAEVRAFREEGLVTIREGTNGMVCLGDNPAVEDWHTACYQEELEPFMKMGRELRAKGVTERPDIDAARVAAIESGEIDFPDHPTSLYSLFGKEGAFDPETGEADTAGGLYVVYIPYSTEKTTGMSEEGSRTRPWLMFPGTPWSHVMIPRPPKVQPEEATESN